MLYVIAAFLAGFSVVISRTINSNLASKLGLLQGTIFNYIVGLLFSFIFLFFSSEQAGILQINLTYVPLWAYLGGVLGVIVVALSSYITPKITAFYLTLLIFVGQLFIGMLIDYFTLKQLSLEKILGGLLVLVGLIYNLILDKKTSCSVKTEDLLM